MNKTLWYKLNGFSCPVAKCKGQKGTYNWVCSKHRKQMYIAQTGYLGCSVKGHCDKIIQWRFDCGNHGDHPVEKYQHADFQGFSLAVSHAVQLMDTAGARWVGALCKELGEQYKRQGPREPERLSNFDNEPQPQNRRRPREPERLSNFDNEPQPQNRRRPREPERLSNFDNEPQPQNRRRPREPERRSNFTTQREPRPQNRRRHTQPRYQTDFRGICDNHDDFFWTPPRIHVQQRHDVWCDCLECNHLDLC